MFIFNYGKLTRKLFVAILIIGTSFLQASEAATIIAGVDDNFSGGIDPAAPSAELSALLGDATVGFDGVPHNEQVAHTFTGLPTITSATLELRIKGGVNPGVDTDGIFISFVNSTTGTLINGVEWSRTFGEFAGGGTVFSEPDPGIATPGLIWAPDSSAYLTLDLSALPLVGGGTLDIIPIINSNGFFDVTVSDDSAADFYRLTYNVGVVPLPPSVLLFGSGLLILFRIKKSQAGA